MCVVLRQALLVAEPLLDRKHELCDALYGSYWKNGVLGNVFRLNGWG